MWNNATNETTLMCLNEYLFNGLFADFLISIVYMFSKHVRLMFNDTVARGWHFWKLEFISYTNYYAFTFIFGEKKMKSDSFICHSNEYGKLKCVQKCYLLVLSCNYLMWVNLKWNIYLKWNGHFVTDNSVKQNKLFSCCF